MKILITGSAGQLGKELLKILPERHQVIGYGRDMDVTDYAQVVAKVADARPDLIIHCAALTNVDFCETNPEVNYRVNTLGTENVALAAQKLQASLVYISTDYVFDGEKGSPYLEYDLPRPLNHYGLAKLAGERIIESLLDHYFIVRTSWLYNKEGKNFVSAMLRLAKEKDELRVVNDQIGTPTYAPDLAQCISKLIETDYYGIYHASNEGSCSWYDFAREILELAGFKKVRVIPITSEEYGSPTKRPKYSVLDNFCSRERGIFQMRDYRSALKEFFQCYN
ncbi:dTDP-4-dehydrorhamnose reductase [Candidatus Hakubella thermalkaliphila]|uniref:dTDP-4-dehydrorhamnose reductase n=1 Tax=Candidatus Hakubella thermalkaliphila TaxID=2754717 RepID=A0A6V8Q2F0_9ACTN|nr:dTDP-4-dehydrorhamnose reductase [Candidatus Hakubella thermalkaliphila]GFP19254.1 dTDP-4-dehydrorhamnose reductase [Candidatus Hakubella thermalkaliphila]GFP30874.1 dTDP-4-dehydrorhamnose reductase [Candidatus Hakubella thermalkaliphila]GFP37512.1 dTDP-4-dehydrorhamnose reductase [Candidatus Hakubella thermalkaliphila]GFP38922.1 dTDP-4-dehydrorhamnose reductase [Candidatus Hakubella thermalkaliphila]GFP42833.1 dTDP-4-dehydrorhamnose reductase [Candidatus Hakubella thermalkaliphila]